MTSADPGFAATCGRLNDADLSDLRCPRCRRTLRLQAAEHRPSPRGPVVERGRLVCPEGHVWPIERGLARLYEEREVRGNDRLLRAIYHHLAPLHDPVVAVALPLCGSGRETELRRRAIARMALGELGPDPVRILEVGIGSGSNVGWIRDHLPAGVRFELWGVDLAEGMIRLCERRWSEPFLRLAMADAHALPFPDGFFDRVVHIGATNNYRDPERALAEMGRVARAGTPVVVVDERLDPGARNSLYHRAMFRLVTFYDWAPRAPASLVPRDAVEVRDEQIARFFYCLTFRMPAGGPSSVIRAAGPFEAT